MSNDEFFFPDFSNNTIEPAIDTEGDIDFNSMFDEATKESSEEPLNTLEGLPTAQTVVPPVITTIDDFFNNTDIEKPIEKDTNTIIDDDNKINLIKKENSAETIMSAEDVLSVIGMTSNDIDDDGVVITNTPGFEIVFEEDDNIDTPVVSPDPIPTIIADTQTKQTIKKTKPTTESLPLLKTDEDSIIETEGRAAILSNTVSTETISLEDMPKWMVEIQEKLRSSVSHSFSLELNIKDYAYKGISVRDLVTYTLNQEYSYYIIAYYNLADGLTFPSWDEGVYKKRLMEITGKIDSINSLVDDEVFKTALSNEALKMGVNEEDLINETINSALPTKPETVLGLLRPLFEQKITYEGENTSTVPAILLYIDSVETILPDQPMYQMKLEERKMLLTLKEIARSTAADIAGNCLIMTTENPSETHSALKTASTRIEKIKIRLPDKEERLQFINEQLVTRPSETPLFDENMSPITLANLAAGLSKTQIEDIALRAESKRVSINETFVKERKADFIKSEYEDVIEILEPVYSFDDIGGEEHLKEFCTNEVILPIKTGNLNMVPQGILLLGSPGTGKTMFAHALAYESKMNCINLNLSKILDKWVGSSEKNFEKALECIKAMTPVIVLVEEIDEAFPKRGGDSTNVSGRLFKSFLEFLSDPSKRGNVLVVATSNYPSRMDPALKRPGRFDKKIPFLVPDELSRMKIMMAIAKRMSAVVQLPGPIPADSVKAREWFLSLKSKMDELHSLEIASTAGESVRQLNEQELKLLKLRQVLRSTEGMTGAEIETILQKAIALTLRKITTNGKPQKDPIPVLIDELLSACLIMVPSTSAIAEMTIEALKECNDLEFIPPELHEKVRQLKSQELLNNPR